MGLPGVDMLTLMKQLAQADNVDLSETTLTTSGPRFANKDNKSETGMEHRHFFAHFGAGGKGT